jgi:hypothetical protein
VAGSALPFADAIKQAVEQAVTRARRCTRKTAPTNATGTDDEEHETGRLHKILEDATCFELCNADELTVLSKDKDPYRLDTASGHRLGRWCAQMIEQFLAADAKIHLRGLHYLLASPGDLTRPDGKRYINTDEMWRWLTETAIKAARWLGYVPFERIVDERNAPPELYLSSYCKIEPERGRGQRIITPDPEEAVPRFASPSWPIIQPYRIILIGEKTSLRPVLLPIAQEVTGELLLPTGEPSDTMIHDLASRCALDPRPSVVLYFSDFDPSGRQMTVSVSRKLQGLHDLLYPNLNIRLHQVALTREQVRELDLPSTPLKATEQRASRWREVMGHEQTEIDALAALRPEALTAIARDAVLRRDLGRTHARGRTRLVRRVQGTPDEAASLCRCPDKDRSRARTASATGTKTRTAPGPRRCAPSRYPAAADRVTEGRERHAQSGAAVRFPGRLYRDEPPPCSTQTTSRPAFALACRTAIGAGHGERQQHVNSPPTRKVKGRPELVAWAARKTQRDTNRMVAPLRGGDKRLPGRGPQGDR